MCQPDSVQRGSGSHVSKAWCSLTHSGTRTGACAICGKIVYNTEQRCKTLDGSAYQHMRCTPGADPTIFERKPKEATLANGQKVTVNGLKIRKPVEAPAVVSRDLDLGVQRPRKLCAAVPLQNQEFVKAKTTLPSRVDLRKWMTPVENQGQTNSCCANAVAGAYEYLCSRHAKENGLDQVGDISRLFVYYVGRLCDAAE